MTKEEMLDKALRHLQEVHEGPFLVEGGPLQVAGYRIAELYNAVRMLGAVTEIGWRNSNSSGHFLILPVKCSIGSAAITSATLDTGLRSRLPKAPMLQRRRYTSLRLGALSGRQVYHSDL